MTARFLAVLVACSAHTGAAYRIFERTTLVRRVLFDSSGPPMLGLSRPNAVDVARALDDAIDTCSEKAVRRSICTPRYRRDD